VWESITVRVFMATIVGRAILAVLLERPMRGDDFGIVRRA
jgi:hypothetical protein